MFVWAKIPKKFADGKTVSDYLLYNAHVFITPGFIFGSSGDQYIRLSLCVDEKNLNEAKERIVKLIKRK
jgi:aspartate/methionine/tyrosine aminotransferase